MPLQQYDAASLVSVPLDISLSNVNLNQGTFLFDGGYTFNFSSILSGVNDVKCKNYSNFYLTSKNKLSEYVDTNTLSLEPTSFLTTIASGNNYVSIVPLSGSNFTNYDYYFNLELTDTPNYNQYFEITFIENEYCTVKYNDGLSEYFLVVENGVGILRKSLFVNNTFSATGEQFFKYILNEDKLFLIKNVNSQPIQLASVRGKLSAVSTVSMTPDTFRENYFTISNNINLNIRNKVSTDYINYKEDNLTIDIANSQLDLQNNFILYRNLNKDTISTVNLITLKNQMSDLDNLSKSNNLSYYKEDFLTDLREYTSIFNDVDAEADEGLELNYVFYNKSIPILPGSNYFKTESVLTPFTQININDTKFAEAGAFAFNNPVYSDRVYYVNKLNDDSVKTYLCTWLSGSPYGNNSVWVDRYYYPDYITKRQALLSTPTYNTTYNSYLETLISTNASLSSNVSVNYVFDKKSDMVFTPNTEYVYERFDLNSVDFSDLNIYGKNQNNYYTEINSNGGFTLKCTLVNQPTDTLNVISTKYKAVQGGVNISYNNTELYLTITLYDQSKNDFFYISRTIQLIANVDNKIVLDVNSNKGIVQLYLNGTLVLSETFFSQYYKLLYGDFYAGDVKITEFVSYLDDVLLTTSPLTQDELNVLVIRDSLNTVDEFTIALPCGMRNSTDRIVQLNSITTNQMSKSNSVNLNISNIGITDENILNEIKTSLQNNISDLVPVNTNVNQINILS